MASNGIFRIPREFKDEDKWFRYFNKKQAIVLVLTLLVDYRIIMTASESGLIIPAIIAAIILTMTIVGIVMVELPADVMFLTGGGITLDQWILRVALRKRKRVLYVKNTQEEGKDC